MTSGPKSEYRQQLESLRAFIGNTPMVGIQYTWKDTPRIIYAKCEYFNHTGSIKDRMVLHMLSQAAERGLIAKGTHIVEATSGNTGISFASIGKKLGNPVTIVVPDWISEAKKALITLYGAKVREVSTEEGGFLNAMLMCETLAEETSGVFLPRQFSNPLNTEVHEKHTGVEIFEQLKRLRLIPDGFVAGVGTGGTLMGVGKALKSVNPGIYVNSVEPLEDPHQRKSFGKKGASHRIHGIADNFVPALINPKALGETLYVHDGDAIVMAQRFMSEIGLGVGISSAANFLAAVELQHILGDDKVIVTIFPDSNKKYHADLMLPEPVRPHYKARHIELKNYSPVPSLGRAVL